MYQIIQTAVGIAIAIATFLSAYYLFHIQRQNRSKEHSQKLNKEVFEPWSSTRFIGREKVMGSEVIETRLGSINLHREKFSIESYDLMYEDSNLAKSHLKTGYSNLWIKWNNIEKENLDFLENVKNLLEMLENKIKENINEAKLLIWGGSGKEPVEYIIPSSIAVYIYVHIYYDEKDYIDEWIVDEKSRKLLHGNRITVAKSESTNTLKKLKKIILEIQHNTRRKILDLNEKRNEIERKIEEFQESLKKDIVQKVKHGGVIKGKCEACP